MAKILVKISGDVNEDQGMHNFIRGNAEKNTVVVICGAGKQINKVLKENGFLISFGELGREIGSDREWKLILKVLMDESRKVSNYFSYSLHNLIVIPSLHMAGPIACPRNGDDLVKDFYLGFQNPEDRIIVYTTKDREKKKQEIFKNYPRVEIKTI
jgi:hypothetical protein